MVQLYTDSGGKFITHDGGKLMSGAGPGDCCCDVEFQDCAEVNAYLQSKPARTFFLLSTGFPWPITTNGCDTGCGGMAGMGGVAVGPHGAFGGGIEWTMPRQDNQTAYLYCQNTNLDFSGFVIYRCTLSGLFVQISGTLSQGDPPFPPPPNCVNLNYVYAETFPWPGGSLPVNQAWLDGAFEVAHAPTPNGCCNMTGTSVSVF